MSTISLQLDLWGKLALADKDPFNANLPELWTAIDESIDELPTESKLTIAGDAIVRIAQIFALRSIAAIDELNAIGKVEPVLPLDCFDRFVRRSMVVDFDRFIVPLNRPFRLANEVTTAPSIVLDEREKLLAEAINEEVDFTTLTTLAGDDTPVIWSNVIATYLQLVNKSVSFRDLLTKLELKPVELWLGSILGSFVIKGVENDFYDAEGLTLISLISTDRQK
ncbi:MAG: hypothetical protein HC778_02220 [Chamaesiphon sp. CSU_1_12]|nr:hypothetical protein [Chamaesiphon sp. CSU_1_12]